MRCHVNSLKIYYIQEISHKISTLIQAGAFLKLRLLMMLCTQLSFYLVPIMSPAIKCWLIYETVWEYLLQSQYSSCTCATIQNKRSTKTSFVLNLPKMYIKHYLRTDQARYFGFASSQTMHLDVCQVALAVCSSETCSAYLTLNNWSHLTGVKAAWTRDKPSGYCPEQLSIKIYLRKFILLGSFHVQCKTHLLLSEGSREHKISINCTWQG